MKDIIEINRILLEAKETTISEKQVVSFLNGLFRSPLKGVKKEWSNFEILAGQVNQKWCSVTIEVDSVSGVSRLVSLVDQVCLENGILGAIEFRYSGPVISEQCGIRGATSFWIRNSTLAGLLVGVPPVGN